jgi:hypothetical protein
LVPKNYDGRYLAFAFTGRPNGGMADCVGGFESQSDAEQAIKLLWPVPAYAHVFDTEAREILNVASLVTIGDNLRSLNS